MIPAILGKKVGTTQVYDEAGTAACVTVVRAGPCVVLQVRRPETAGYEAVQLGFDDVKPARSTKPMIGHCAMANSSAKRFIREVRMPGASGCEPGETVTVEVFEQAETKHVDITGITKGRGFAGVMKRYGFGGQPDSHGTKRKHRAAGSISSFGSEVGDGGGLRKGKKMAGHMGNARCTVRNQQLLGIIKDQNLLVIKGAVPGPAGSYVMIRASKTKA